MVVRLKRLTGWESQQKVAGPRRDSAADAQIECLGCMHSTQAEFSTLRSLIGASRVLSYKRGKIDRSVLEPESHVGRSGGPDRVH